MQLINQIHPTKAQFQELVNNYPKDQPVVMINILRYRDKTGNGAETGETAYARYGKNVLSFMKKAKARLIWRGDVNNTIIGNSDGQPQVVLLVEYPSIQNFIKMTTDSDYIKIA